MAEVLLDAAPGEVADPAVVADTIVAEAKPRRATRKARPATQVSPRARRTATKVGLDAGNLVGSGPGGRVLSSDVRAALELAGIPPDDDDPTPPPAPRPARAAGPAAEEIADEPAFPGPYTDTPLVETRGLVADRILAASAAHAQSSFTTSAPAGALLRLRAWLKNSEPLGLVSVTIGDLVAFAVARVAARFPTLNATIQEQMVRSWESVHLGIAVDTSHGLLVPTIRFASQLGLRDLSAEIKTSAGQAGDGSIDPAFLSGATFVITNLGAQGIEAFTPRLHLPQVAILGIGAIVARPVINSDGTTGVESRIGLTLTVDYSVVRAAEATRFLKDLVSFLADIDLAILAEGGLGG